MLRRTAILRSKSDRFAELNVELLEGIAFKYSPRAYLWEFPVVSPAIFIPELAHLYVHISSIEMC